NSSSIQLFQRLLPLLPPLDLSGEFGLKESTNFAFSQTLFFQYVYEFVDQLLCVPHLFCLGQASPSGGDKCSESMPYFKHAFLFQLTIDLDDGIGVDDQRLCQAANAWQLLSSRD